MALFSFSVWWCMSFFVHGVLCLVKPVKARFLSLLNSVKYDSSLISFSAPWQVNSFFNICDFFILCSYSFFFEKKFSLVMQLQFRNFPNYLFMQLQFLSRN